jgi:hypothetical protein
MMESEDKMSTVRFGIVGGGWRAEFYLRIARALPERFVIEGMVVRDADKGRAIEEAWGVSTYRTVSDLLRAVTPQFVVSCVPWEANPTIVEELVAGDMPVLSETPPAPDVQRMEALWELVREGARIQVAEQYIHQPHHAARLAFVADDLLGTVSQAKISAAHGYHGISLLRHFLGVGYENARITAREFSSPLVGGPTRSGPPSEERIKESEQIIAWLEFEGEAAPRLGVFDFTGDQYFSWVRGQRLLVRGERGEIIDERASYLLDYATPMQVEFRRMSAGARGNLEGYYLKGIVAGGSWYYRNPFIAGRLSDDEIAVATALAGMADYVEGGPEVYSLAEACQDRYLDIMIAEAIDSGTTMSTETQVWAEV